MSDRIRYGKITKLDMPENRGTITDVNEQEIDFEFNGQKDVYQVHDPVNFIIRLVNSRLMAVDVKRAVVLLHCVMGVWLPAFLQKFFWISENMTGNYA